jgi:Uma2 family endonuclease
VDHCANKDETAWFLCENDFNGVSDSAYRWNEFETQSLEAAEGDELWKTQILDFWRYHFPICFPRSLATGTWRSESLRNFSALSFWPRTRVKKSSRLSLLQRTFIGDPFDSENGEVPSALESLLSCIRSGELDGGTSDDRRRGAAPLDTRSAGLTDEQFSRLCADNPELRLELTAERRLVIMSPTGSKTGWRNHRLASRPARGRKRTTRIGFRFLGGVHPSERGKALPDAWILRERWESLSEEQQEDFAPLCPDFVVELRSPRDRLSTLQTKLEEYMQNGAKLGWIIDPKSRCVFVYRPGQAMERLENPLSLSGEAVLPGFVFTVSEIW